MGHLGVIVREDGPTDWVSNIVVVEKSDNKLRVCLDPKHLNKAVKRSHFLLPTKGAKFFSKCDA
jgi:predicted double-glycine peptidase